MKGESVQMGGEKNGRKDQNVDKKLGGTFAVTEGC